MKVCVLKKSKVRVYFTFLFSLVNFYKPSASFPEEVIHFGDISSTSFFASENNMLSNNFVMVKKSELFMFWNFTWFALLSFLITLAKLNGCHDNGSVKTIFMTYSSILYEK